MQYDAGTPAEYMKRLEDDWRRETVRQLREAIRAGAPGLAEGINYKMLSFADDAGVVFHLNAQKNYVSLYVGDLDKVDVDGALLKGLSRGKGCVRFGKSVKVADTRIGEFIERVMALRRAGTHLGC